MPTELLWVDSIQDDFKGIPEKDQEMIVKRCEKAATNPAHFLELLKGSPFHKIKVGKYRVIVKWERDITIYAILVDLRKKVYKRLDREEKRIERTYLEAKQKIE